MLELTTDSQVSFSEGRDNRHTLDGIASWLGGGKSQCGIPGWDVTGPGNSSGSDLVVCAKEKTDSAASSKSSKISYLEAARNFANCRSAENRSISKLRDFNSVNISQQNLSKQSSNACRQLFPDTGCTMANNRASSQGINNTRGSLDPGWPIDKDEVYFSDDEKEEEAGVKIPIELDCRTTLINTSPFQYSHSNPVDSNLRALNPWASVYSPFNRSVAPYNAYSLSVDGSFISGFQKPGDQPNSYLDDFVMPRFPVQMSSQYSPNESRMFTPPKANTGQKQDAWPSSAAVQNTVSPHAVQNTVSPHPIYRFPAVNSACAMSVEARKTAAPESNADVTVLSAIAAKSKVLQLLQSHKVLVLLRGCPGSGKSTLAK